MTNKHTSWIIKGDEVGYKSDADDQSFGMFCPVAIITDMDQIGLIAAAPETAAELDRLKEINAELLTALVRISLDIDRQRRAGMNLSLLCLCTESLANAAIAKATGQALQDLADIGQELNI